MLSYAEHGKFRTNTQERTSAAPTKAAKILTRSPPASPFRSNFRNVLPDKWTTGGAAAQGARRVR
jgi:hypothetical protein